MKKPRCLWIPGLPRLANDTRHLFTVRLSNGHVRRLYWLENFTLDSHGDEEQHTGWFTCRENLREGYSKFFEPYTTGQVTHYRAESF